MTGPDAVQPRPPWSWLAAVAGFGVQTVVTIGTLVSLVVEAVQKHAQSEAKGGITDDGFLDRLGVVVTVVFAVVVGVRETVVDTPRATTGIRTLARDLARAGSS